MRCEHCPVTGGTECHGETWHKGLCDLAATGQPGALDLIRYRATLPRVPEPPPRVDPPLPSPLTMAGNLARAVVTHIATGGHKADPETVRARLAVCEACPDWRSSDSRCSVCGCYTQAKTELQSSKCPLGKW